MKMGVRSFSRYSAQRPALSAIVSALILFVMLFTVGTGFFLWANTNNLAYTQALANRVNSNQDQQSESIILSANLTVGSQDLAFRANNTGATPVNLVSV